MTEETKATTANIFILPPEQPVMEASDGIRFDFNDGLRVQFPKEGGPWHITFKDLDTGIILGDGDAEPGSCVTSVKKYFVRFGFQIWRKGENCPIFTHEFNALNHAVMVQMPVPTLGDTLAWFPYVEKFRRKHDCQVLAVLQPQFTEILRNQYPGIGFITKEQAASVKPYATYRLGLFFGGDVDHQPCDFRLIGLAQTAGHILGVDPEPERPRFELSAPRTIQESYVCISVQSTSQCKHWNNPAGWYQVIDFLKSSGYRVLCVDKARFHGAGLQWNHIPHGAEDCTGPLPLQERVNLIKDADFFVGLASGLSWLAWGCGVPVVLISGFSHPVTEFPTPYRVINYHACNSCWNDPRHDFDHYDFLWCPRHAGTDRQFECTRLIAGEQVINMIKRIPKFQDHIRKRQSA